MIDPFTLIPIKLDVLKGEREIAKATGFIIDLAEKHFLITNWHVVTGRNYITKAPLGSLGGEDADPDRIRLWRLRATEESGGLTTYSWVNQEELIKDNAQNKRWLEHPRIEDIDVVALPIERLVEGFAPNNLDLGLANADLLVTPSESVSIIGFIYGRGVRANFPIWKTGHVASDIELPYDNKPAFLIDATTREGMSGSPVVAKRASGFYRRVNGNFIGGATVTRFMGIYSGRIPEEPGQNSNLGIVWKPEIINQIIEH
ncbi:MAG: serine protease [Patescibacteria group bacterium]